MEKRIIYTDEKQRELVRPLNSRFLVRVESENIYDFIFQKVALHWHPEFELAVVTKGALTCQANGKSLRIQEGEGILYNSNALHGYSAEEGLPGLYEVLILSPRFFGEPGSLLYDKYMAPILLSSDLSGLFLSPSIPWQKQFLDTALEIFSLDREQPPHLELAISERLFRMWQVLWKNIRAGGMEDPEPSRDVSRMKEAMTYIQSSYREPVTLASIAASCSLSQSECCRLFRRFLHQSPIDYVISWRISVSMSLLSKGGLSMTEIAEQTGFQSSSYFSETFKRLTGMTPSAYKKQISKNS